MKAIVYSRYGPPEVLALRDVETPAPKDGEVLVRAHAASVNALDWRPFTLPLVFVRILRGGLREPKDTKVGVDVAGRVQAVGAAVTRFRRGDEVFGTARGAFAEYVCAAEDALVPKPANVSFEAAAAVPVAALTALQGLRDKGRIQPGQEVLVHGAGGGVGTFAVQLAKALGARVTAVCSPRNVDMVRAIGADHVIDYTREDFTRLGRSYDLIAAVNGDRSVLRYRQALKPGGTCVVLGGSMKQILQALVLGPVLSRMGNRKVEALMTRGSREDLSFLKDLLAAGKVVPVIDRRYPLERAAEAIEYLVQGHARGKVVLTV
jgi:NADPH:quinone reductase-like Zn-dependent oxidoreductase